MKTGKGAEPQGAPHPAWPAPIPAHALAWQPVGNRSGHELQRSRAEQESRMSP